MQGAQVGHDGGSARDRIGEVIVVDGVTEPLLVRPRRLLSKPLYGRAIGRFDEIEQGKMRMRFEQLGAELGGAIEWQGLAEDARERSDDLPVLARLTGRKNCARGHLRPTFGIHVNRTLLSVGGARKDDIGAVRTLLAMAALIDDEGVSEPLHIDLVGPEQIDDVELSGGSCIEHAFHVEAAIVRNKADVEPADARGRVMQDVEAIPAGLDRAHRHRGFCGKSENRRAILPGECRLSHHEYRPLGAFELLQEGMGSIGDFGERLGPSTEIIVGIGEIGLFADKPDGRARLALADALQDPRVEDGRLTARIGADDEEGVGTVDSFDGRVEDIGRAAECRVELSAILTAVDIGRAKPLGKQLQREHLLASGKIAGDCSEPFAVKALQLPGDEAEGLIPACRLKLAVAPDIRPVDPLRAQAIPHVARLVRNPFLVDGLVLARENAQNFAPASIDANSAPYRIHDIDRRRLGQLPGPCHEGVRLRRKRADRAKIDHVAGQVREHAALEIGGDLHVLATSDGAELLHAGHLGHEAYAARAVNAAVHVGVDQRPEIFLLDRTLIVLEAARIESIGHGLILQIALATLVADRAIERMIDEQELEHALARLLYRLRIGDDAGRRTVARGSQVVYAHGARGDGLRHAGHFDQAHAAIAGNRQALVVAEAGNLDAGNFAGLDQRDAIRHLVLFAVDDQLRHLVPHSAATGTEGAMGSVALAWMRASMTWRKWRINPCTGQAAASPSAQMV